MIASPSATNPNYLFTWTRDSSLVFKAIIDQYTSGADTTLRTLIDQFVSAEAILQQVSNPSGTVSTGGLGEPKFNIDESAFTGAWGRPQRGKQHGRFFSSRIGPNSWDFFFRRTCSPFHGYYQLRQLVGRQRKHDLCHQHSLAHHQARPRLRCQQLEPDHVRYHPPFEFYALSLTPQIFRFDLWEEVSSSSFFTTAVQHRSLREGAALATKIGQTSVVSGYTTQAANLLCFLQVSFDHVGACINPLIPRG